NVVPNAGAIDAARDTYLREKKRFSETCRRAALAWWQQTQWDRAQGSINLMMKAVSRSLRWKRQGPGPAEIMAGDRRPVDAVADHFEAALNHNASDISIDDNERARHVDDGETSPFTEESV
ncbi:hypothetical protein H4R21_006601, partial [Coemansia helicoidea]